MPAVANSSPPSVSGSRPPCRAENATRRRGPTSANDLELRVLPEVVVVGDGADQAVLAGLQVDRRLSRLAREERLGRLAVALLLLGAQGALELHDREVVGQAAFVVGDQGDAP